MKRTLCICHVQPDLPARGWFKQSKSLACGHADPHRHFPIRCGTSCVDCPLWLRVLPILERRETRKVGQREKKRTREAGTKMQCSTWCFIPSEATFRKYNFIRTLNVQTYALEMFTKIPRKTNLPPWLRSSARIESELNRSIIGFELS